MAILSIPLTQGKVALVDEEDYERLAQHRWYARRTPSGAYYAMRTVKDEDGKLRNIHMHQEVLPPPPGKQVDHKDRDGLNNTRGNLRHGTQQQNLCNRRLMPSNKSGYRGVCQQKGRTRFIASISVHNEKIYLGTFKTAAQAARAYDKAARKAFGEFAQLNYPRTKEDRKAA